MKTPLTQAPRSVTVTPAAVHEYNVYCQEFLQRTVWTGGCTSWYKNDGRVTAMYCGSVLALQRVPGELPHRGLCVRVPQRKPVPVPGERADEPRGGGWGSGVLREEVSG